MPTQHRMKMTSLVITVVKRNEYSLIDPCIPTHRHGNTNLVSLIVKKFFLSARSTLNIALYTHIMSQTTAGYTFAVDLNYAGVNAAVR